MSSFYYLWCFSFKRKSTLRELSDQWDLIGHQYPLGLLSIRKRSLLDLSGSALSSCYRELNLTGLFNYYRETVYVSRYENDHIVRNPVMEIMVTDTDARTIPIF